MVVAAVPITLLESFLALPETEPAQEYNQGIITQKPIPKGKHSTIQVELASAINQQAKPKKIAYALPELRCTFGDRSIVPDISVIRWKNLPRDEDGEIADRFNQAPDWIIEIASPEQSMTLLMEKILFCLNAGTELGWLIDPGTKCVTVFTQGLPQVHFGDAEGTLRVRQPEQALQVMEEIKDWQITASMIFDWLKVE